MNSNDLSQILEVLPLAVYVIDANGKSIYANQASVQLLGKAVDPSAKPEDLSEIYRVYVAGTDDIYPTERLPIVRALGGETVVVDDMEIRRPDGTVSIEVMSKPILDEKGTIKYAVAAFKDVTARKAAEHEAASKHAEIEKMNQFMIGRELKLKELKEEITALREEVTTLRQQIAEIRK